MNGLAVSNITNGGGAISMIHASSLGTGNVSCDEDIGKNENVSKPITITLARKICTLFSIISPFIRKAPWYIKFSSIKVYGINILLP